MLEAWAGAARVGAGAKKVYSISATRKGNCPVNQRAEALADYARRNIRERERKLDEKEKQQRYMERTLPGRIMDEDERERRAISRAKERLARYAPEPGKEDCPICFVFDAREMKRALSFHAEGSGSVKASCSSCGFTGSIPCP